MCLSGVLTFQPHFKPSQSKKKRDFCRIFSFCSFLEFVRRITPLQIELEIRNLLRILNKSPRCAFLRFSNFWVKIQWCPNSKKGVLRGQKSKICPFFDQSIENQKLYNISENQSPKSIRRGDMGFLPFLTSKKCCSSSISPFQIELASWNLVCIFSWCPRHTFWGSWLFIPISSSHSP